MYFYIVPTLFPNKNTANPTETIEPVEPVSWLSFFIKTVGGLLVLGVLMLLMIYFRQEGMLYVPSQPI